MTPRTSLLRVSRSPQVKWLHDSASLFDISRYQTAHAAPLHSCSGAPTIDSTQFIRRLYFMPANDPSRALVSRFQDAWLLAGVRTPFVDYTQALSLVSPIDLGIKAAREVLARSGASARRRRHRDRRVAWHRPVSMPMYYRGTSGYTLVYRWKCRRTWSSACAARASRSSARPQTPSRSAALARAVRGRGVDEPQPDRRLHASVGLPPRRAGGVQGLSLGSPAGPGGRHQHGRHRRKPGPPLRHRRPEVDAYAARSFERAIAAQESGFLAGEICAGQERDVRGRGSQAARHQAAAARSRRSERDTHVRPHFARDSSRRSVRPSAACRRAATAPPSSTARRACSSPPATTSRR